MNESALEMCIRHVAEGKVRLARQNVSSRGWPKWVLPKIFG
jgi:hypothetical protein